MIDVLSRYSYRCPGNCTASSKREGSLFSSCMLLLRSHVKMRKWLPLFTTLKLSPPLSCVSVRFWAPGKVKVPAGASSSLVRREFRSAACRVDNIIHTGAERNVWCLERIYKGEKASALSLSLARSLTLHFVLAAIYKPRMNILSL